MKRTLYIVGLVCISVMDLSGQATQDSKNLFKGLLGTDFQKLGDLDSRLYCDVISVNGGMTAMMIYHDSAFYSIKYWFSSEFDFKEVKLIEFELVKIDTSKTQSIWGKVVTAWTNEDGRKAWSLDEKTWDLSKNNIKVRLPSTSYSYVGIQKSSGEVKVNLLENLLTSKPTTVEISRSEVDKGDVIVAYFESDNKIYIGFYKS